MSFLKRLFVPYRCLSCRRVLPLSSGGGFCSSCQALVFRCEEEDLPFAEGADTATVFAYGGAVAHVIKRMKDRPDPQAAAYFAKEIAAMLSVRFPGASWDGIAYVPRYQSDYTQTAYLASALGRIMKLPILHYALYKKKNTRKQRECRYRFERRRNVRDAYAVAREEEVFGKKILLVDDVMTTGATVQACTETLTETGADTVTAVTVSLRSKRDLLAGFLQKEPAEAKPVLYAVSPEDFQKATFRYRIYKGRRRRRK